MQYSPDHEADTRALHWLTRLESEPPLTQEEREEFQKWLADDPSSERRFLDYGMILTLMRELGAEARVSSPQREARLGNLLRSLPLKLTAVVAVVVCLTLGLLLAFNSPRLSRMYETGTGQTQTVEFKEGSVAYLNTRTQLHWLGRDNNSRRVELLSGEATFEVARDERRAFAVIVEDSEIRALGTRFNVYRKADARTVVTVFEGSVEVRGPAGDTNRPGWVRTLNMGEQIEYQRSAPVAEPHETDTTLASNWRSGTLQLPKEGAPLAEVISELTRYTDKTIVLADPTMEKIRIGGRFSTRDVAFTLKWLTRTARLIVREQAGAYVVEYPNGTADSNGGEVDEKP